MTERVLLVDDETEFLEIMAERMRARDMEVTTSTSASEAMGLIETESYDAVIMDFQMPEMDGYEATRLIRQNPDLQELPIIAMTAHAMTGDREKCLNAGMDDYMTKPIKKEKVFEIIENLSKKEDL